MGQLDQFAKRAFADDTGPVTAGGAAWQIPPEIGLTHMQGDGVILIKRPELLAGLPPPWSKAVAQQEIFLEVNMCRDHFDAIAFERAGLRRQARQAQRVEEAHEGKLPRPSQEGLWFVASHVPGWLREVLDVMGIAEGCYRLGPAWFHMLLIAANERAKVRSGRQPAARSGMVGRTDGALRLARGERRGAGGLAPLSGVAHRARHADPDLRR